MKKHLLFLLCSLLVAFNIHAQTSVGYKDGWPRPNGAVYAIAVSGNMVYIGGDFTNVGGQTRNHLAAYDAITGALLPWNPDVDGDVYALAANGNTVYVGGIFALVGGQSRSNIAAIDATTGNVTSWDPNAIGISSISSLPGLGALAVSGTTVYAGGNFTNIGGQSRNNIAALDATTGTATSWNPDADDEVYSLVVSGNTVYAGGQFTFIGGQSRNSIAAIDAITGNATVWNPYFLSTVTSTVTDLTVSGNTVYAGGLFSSIGGQIRKDIVAIDVNTGTATSWNPSPRGIAVQALVVNGNTIYTGGEFSFIGGQSRNYIAAIDATTGAATSWNPNANGRIYALAVSGNTVYVGGQFTSMAGDNSRSYFMALRDSNTVLGVASPAVLEEGFSFSAFPNPAGEKVMVRSNGAISQSAVVQVMSILGAAVKEQQMQNGQTELDLSGMASGIYLLRYKDTEGRTGIVRIQKQ